MFRHRSFLLPVSTSIQFQFWQRRIFPFGGGSLRSALGERINKHETQIDRFYLTLREGIVSDAVPLKRGLRNRTRSRGLHPASEPHGPDIRPNLSRQKVTPLARAGDMGAIECCRRVPIHAPLARSTCHRVPRAAIASIRPATNGRVRGLRLEGELHARFG
jgi:hypothetical protein